MSFKLRSRKTSIIAVILIICLIITGVVFYCLNYMPAAKTPTYQTVLPKDKAIDQLGGWRRISPPKEDPVFAYSDTIDNVAINVSEQWLPKSFISDPEGAVAELAKSYNASDKILTGSATLYVGTSANGPQSAILTKNNLLILIKSANKISDASWAKYVESLH